MVLEDRALKVLDCVSLPVDVRYLLKLIANRKALLGKATMFGPVPKKAIANCLAGLGKGLAGRFLSIWRGLIQSEISSATYNDSNSDAYQGNQCIKCTVRHGFAQPDRIRKPNE